MKNKTLLFLTLCFLQYKQPTYCIPTSVIKEIGILAFATATPLTHITFTLITLFKSLHQERASKNITTPTYPKSTPPEETKAISNQKICTLNDDDDPYNAPTQEEWDAFHIIIQKKNI